MKNLIATVLAIYIVGYLCNLTLDLTINRFSDFYYLWEKTVTLLLLIFVVKNCSVEFKFAAKVALTISIIRLVWDIFLTLDFNQANNQCIIFGVWLVCIILMILVILKSIGKWK